MKYIDAEKLIAEIERKMKCWEGEGLPKGIDSPYCTLKGVRTFVESLQQEQPEVDLEKEIDAIWNPRFNLGWDEHSALSMNHAGFASIARHFYELGLNARKEEKK